MPDLRGFGDICFRRMAIKTNLWNFFFKFILEKYRSITLSYESPCTSKLVDSLPYFLYILLQGRQTYFISNIFYIYIRTGHKKIVEYFEKNQFVSKRIFQSDITSPSLSYIVNKFS